MLLDLEKLEHVQLGPLDPCTLDRLGLARLDEMVLDDVVGVTMILVWQLAAARVTDGGISFVRAG